MKKVFFIFFLVLPVISIGEMKEITQTEVEREKYLNDLQYGTPDKRWEAAEILGDAGDCLAVKGLIRALDDEVPKVRMYAAEALGKLGDKKAKKPLKKSLKDAYPIVRYAAAEALARLRDRAGVPVMVQAIRDQSVDYKRRARTAEAMGILDDETTISALISVIDDPVSPRVREQTAYALGRMGAGGAVVPLTERLKDEIEEMPMVRLAATCALADIGDKPRSIPPLARTLHDPDASVRNGASEALKRLVGKDRNVIPILIELLEFEDTRKYAEATIDSFFNEREDIPLLSKVVGSGKKAAILYAIRRLEKIKNPAGIFPLVEALEEEDTIIRARAATALGKLGFEEPVPTLIEFVDDSSVLVAKCVIIALGMIKDDRADTTLFRIMKDSQKDWRIRIVAAESVGKLSVKAVLKTLFLFLRHADWKIRYLAAIGLGELSDKKALDALEYTATHETNTEVRDAARVSAAKIREKAFGRTYSE